MNGIKFKLYLLCLLSSLLFSCREVNHFVEDVYVYEPHGKLLTIAELKRYEPDQVIGDDVYVQGTMVSSDAEGNFARQIVIQDATGGITINADMGASSTVYPKGKKLSVQCLGLTLAEQSGVLQLCASVSGEGLRKQMTMIGNRDTRNCVFVVGDGESVTPATPTLDGIDPADHDQQLVSVGGVSFQTTTIPFANAGGSSEQLRTLYDESGNSILLCTRDGSTMAALMLPEGRGTVTGVLTCPDGEARIMISNIEDIDFTPGGAPFVDPQDKVSTLLISEYYSAAGKSYIEVYNSGTETMSLTGYVLATDTESDGVFSASIEMGDVQIAPGGMILYRNQAADVIPWTDTTAEAWDPLRVNYSPIRIDPLNLDGNSQIAIMQGQQIIDILATTKKPDWNSGLSLVRRPGIDGHSKSSDYTRADAGWSTKISGYYYNLGYHKYYDSDPDMDIPPVALPRTILEVRAMERGEIAAAYSITGRVTSDREGGNVEANRLYMQDGSNRGICVEFREGQNHTYDPGDEIRVELYGTTLADRNGLLVIGNATVSRSFPTASPNLIPEAIEASIDQIESLQSMYIYIKDVQISSAEAGKTYGSGAIAGEGLFADRFVLSTLSSAEFASATVSQSSGIMKGIALAQGSDKVLAPRNAADLEGLVSPQFTPITAAPITVEQLRAMPVGTISENVRVSVSVVSDFTGGNYISDDLIFVQGASRGFMMQLPGANTYAFGQNVIVVLKNAVISDTAGAFVVTPASADMIVAQGAPDPAIQPVDITTDGTLLAQSDGMLVTIGRMEVVDGDRAKTFGDMIGFSTGLTDTSFRVLTKPSAEWYGSYLPTASGTVTGLLVRTASGYDLYPRHASDLSGLPTDGRRNNGERVVYFTPSEDAGADLFVSEAVMGALDANGMTVAPTRQNCNAKFVEMFNPTGANIMLENYRVACVKYNNAASRGAMSYYRFPAGLTLKPGTVLVFKYVSAAVNNASGNKMSNTAWPEGYTAAPTSGVEVRTDASPGILVFLDARDYAKSIANSTASFPAFDGNDILVVQKTTDGGATWTEIDRVFTFKTSTGAIGGGISYPYLFTYVRKPGALGVTGNIVDVADPAYSAGGRNPNDFGSTQCDPVTVGAPNWSQLPPNDFTGLGVHAFSTKP